MSLIHAFPAQSVDYDLSEFVSDCGRHRWPILVQEDLTDTAITKFLEDQHPDLGIVIGGDCIPANLLGLPRCGSLIAEITRTPDADVTHLGASEISVRKTETPHSCLPLASIRLTSQPYDSVAGSDLKAELISNDLLLCLIETYAQGEPDRASAKADAWIREMLSACMAVPRQAITATEKSQVQRTRPLWKMAMHTALLISPIVICRNWYRRLRGQFPVVIFFHHLVSDRAHPLGIPTELFLQQVRFLQRYYRVVSLSEALSDLRSGSVTCPTAVLTFDDGYEENFLTMRAVTEQAGISVTLFVCANAVSAHASFGHDAQNTDSAFPSLEWRQIEYWQSDGLEVGSHTLSHFDCGSQDQVALRNEIVRSREIMEAELNRKVNFFAFPWGKAQNMSSPAIEIATSAYDCCFSALDSEIFAGRGNVSKLVGRKFLPSNNWDLELTLQSVFDLARCLKLSTRKQI